MLLTNFIMKEKYPLMKLSSSLPPKSSQWRVFAVLKYAISYALFFGVTREKRPVKKSCRLLNYDALLRLFLIPSCLLHFCTLLRI